MKPVALWLVVVGVAVAAASGCSISHHSDEFACEKQADCASGRTCTDGLCVIPVDAAVKPDAAPPPCPAQCTSCNNDAKTCKVDCAVNSALCARQITCPTGWSCDIACSTASSCRTGIDCTASKSCAITCGGASSCRNLACGAGRCTIGCTGQLSCRNVDCGPSCACDISCGIDAACSTLTCTSGCDSTSPLGGCSSLTPGCNTCP